jgi:hypothetical protein
MYERTIPMISDNMLDKILKSRDIDYRDLLPIDWLQLALDTEEQKRACGALDPAFVYFSERQSDCEKAAALAERRMVIPKSENEKPQS